MNEGLFHASKLITRANTCIELQFIIKTFFVFPYRVLMLIQHHYQINFKKFFYEFNFIY